MIKKFILFFLLIIPSLSFAGNFNTYNPFTQHPDYTNDKASEISLADIAGYYGDTTSPPTVESALQEIAASNETVAAGWTDDGSTVRLTTPTDNVGIGRSNPSAKLHIFGAGTSTGFALRIADSTPTDRLVVMDNGRVGIGLTNPSGALDVIGTVTSDGFTLGNDENITFGTETFTFDSTTSDFEFSDDITIEDTTPHLRLTDTTAAEDDFEIYTDGSQFVLTNVTDLTDILYVNSSNNIRLLRDTTINNDLIHEFSRGVVIEDLTSTDDDKSIGVWTNNVTINKVACSCNGTCTTPATITLEDGSGNAMTHGTVTCTTDGTDMSFVSVTAANTLNSGELLRFNTTNTPNPATDDYTIVVGWTE